MKVSGGRSFEQCRAQLDLGVGIDEDSVLSLRLIPLCFILIIATIMYMYATFDSQRPTMTTGGNPYIKYLWSESKFSVRYELEKGLCDGHHGY
jgi:hypothetical protein